MLVNITQKIQKQTMQVIRREEIDEHMILLNAVIADLQKDIRHYRVPNAKIERSSNDMTINKIISELKEVVAHLIGRLHFLFRI